MKIKHEWGKLDRKHKDFGFQLDQEPGTEQQCVWGCDMFDVKVVCGVCRMWGVFGVYSGM